MAVAHRLRRLERTIGTLDGGRKRCRVCRDGTQPTGVMIVFEGQEPSTRPDPCPGCGRNEPEVINYMLAVPKGWAAPPQTPGTPP